MADSQPAVLRLVPGVERDAEWFRTEVRRHFEASDLDGAILILLGEKLIVTGEPDDPRVLAQLELAKASVVRKLESGG